jgi:hypothetical protein
MLNDSERLANEQDRTVVVLAPSEDKTSISFVPYFDSSKQGVIPFACLSRAATEPANLPREKRILLDYALRRRLSTLLFFEGLRLMAATGSGVRCPVRSIEWGERFIARITGDNLPACCGRNKELVAFWEAGNKAKESGFSPHKWECPRECI